MIQKRDNSLPSSFKSRRIIKKEENFNNLLYQAAKEIINDNLVFEVKIQHYMDYIDVLSQEKNIEKLEKIKGQIQQKQHDIASLLLDQENINEDALYGGFLDEPEPEILLKEETETDSITEEKKINEDIKKEEFEFDTSEINEKNKSTNGNYYSKSLL